MNNQAVDNALPLAERLDWDKCDGMIPAIVQHAASGEVLMQGFMTREALEKTQDTGQVTFFSRSKQRLWTKGETSGHHLELVAIRADCDGDTLLVSAHPHGPTCHTGSNSCFGDAPGQFLGALDALVRQREHDRPLNSYTTKLFEKGTRHIAQKVGEEGVETALAGVAGPDAELASEAADLIFHLLVLLHARNMVFQDVLDVLAERAEAGKGAG